MSESNSAIEAYLAEDRELKFHEIEMLNLIQKHCRGAPGQRLLDLGCADALFINHLRKCYPQSEIIGVELDSTLCERARTLTGHSENIEIIQDDVMQFNDNKKFELIIASGIMTIFEDPFEFLEKYTSMLSANGTLIIFGRFNSFPINSKFLIKHVGTDSWIEPRVSFYTGEIESYLSSKNFTCNFNKFNLPISLQKKDNPFASYTVSLESGEKLVLTGANVVIESFHCVIKPTSI